MNCPACAPHSLLGGSPTYPPKLKKDKHKKEMICHDPRLLAKKGKEKKKFSPKKREGVQLVPPGPEEMRRRQGAAGGEEEGKEGFYK